MGDLISRSEAIRAFAEKREVWYGNGPLPSNESLMWQAAISITENIPAVDAVPVVRCRDCRYWRQEVGPTVHWVCAQHSFDERNMYTTPDFFCADGERRDGE